MAPLVQILFLLDKSPSMRSSEAEEIALGIIEAVVDSLNEYDWANVILMDKSGQSIPCMLAVVVSPQAPLASIVCNVARLRWQASANG